MIAKIFYFSQAELSQIAFLLPTNSQSFGKRPLGWAGTLSLSEPQTNTTLTSFLYIDTSLEGTLSVQDVHYYELDFMRESPESKIANGFLLNTLFNICIFTQQINTLSASVPYSRMPSLQTLGKYNSWFCPP